MVEEDSSTCQNALHKLLKMIREWQTALSLGILSGVLVTVFFRFYDWLKHEKEMLSKEAQSRIDFDKCLMELRTRSGSNYTSEL